MLRDIQEVNPEAGVILITGHPAEMTEMAPAIQRGLAEGAYIACQKPFDVAWLMSIVRRLAE